MSTGPVAPEAVLLCTARRVEWHLPRGIASVSTAARTLAELSQLGDHRPMSVEPWLPQIVAARASLTRVLLEHPELVATAAAARDLLTVGAELRDPPRPDAADLPAYVHHAWLVGHADLSSPARRAQLARNRWLRAHRGHDHAAAAAAVRAAVPGWQAALDAHAQTLPVKDLRELVVHARHKRYLALGWHGSPPRSVLAQNFIRAAFGADHARSREVNPVIADPAGGQFTLVLPAAWAQWLAGPALALTLRPGDPVAPSDVAAHRLALRLWDRGAGPAYRDALTLARDVLAEPTRTP